MTIAQQVVARYAKDESRAALGREFGLTDAQVLAILRAFGQEIRGWKCKPRDARAKCDECGIIFEECEDYVREMERDGMCGYCAWWEDMSAARKRE